MPNTAPHATTVITTTASRPFFRDHQSEPVPEENFWTLWCKGRLTEADTPTIRLGSTPSRLTSAHLHHPPIFFLQAGWPSCDPTNSVKALKANYCDQSHTNTLTVIPPSHSAHTHTYQLNHHSPCETGSDCGSTNYFQKGPHERQLDAQRGCSRNEAVKLSN